MQTVDSIDAYRGNPNNENHTSSQDLSIGSEKYGKPHQVIRSMVMNRYTKMFEQKDMNR